MIELNETGTMIKFIKVRQMNLVTISQSRNQYQLIRSFLSSIFKENKSAAVRLLCPWFYDCAMTPTFYFLYASSVFGTWAIMALPNFVTIRQSRKIVENFFYEVIFYIYFLFIYFTWCISIFFWDIVRLWQSLQRSITK